MTYKLPYEGEFLIEASRGRIEGVLVLHKFGNASNVDIVDVPAVIWDGTCDNIAVKIPQYTYSTSADIRDLASTNANDTQVIEVQGLDTNYALVNQSAQLQGQTVVQLPIPLVRAFRMINRGTTDVLGNIYLSTEGAARVAGLPSVTTTVRAIIKDGDNQTQMAIFTVPDGYEMLIVHGWTTMSKGGGATAVGMQVRVRRREFGGVFRITHTLNLNSSGASGDQRPYPLPIRFKSREDIEYSVLSVSANELGVAAGFHAMLIKE